jgi:hypothetical protein
MPAEPRHVDVTDAPELRRVAEEVAATQQPITLRRNADELAVVVPVRRPRRAPSKARAVTRDDALFGLIGIGRGKTPGGVSGKKHEALAEANRHQ